MVHVNYKSDFILREIFKNSQGNTVPLPIECDIIITYRTSPFKEFTASRINGVYTNCAITNTGSLLIFFNDHGLDRGYLTRTLQVDYRNSIMPDNYLNITNPENTGIELWEHESEVHGVIECDVILNYVQGDKGLPPVIQNGTILTGDAGTDVQLEFTLIGTTDEGNPIYRVDGSIPQGSKGSKGDNLHIDGYYDTLDELKANHPVGEQGDIYLIGEATLYAWSQSINDWSFAGTMKGEKGDKGFPPVIETGTILTGDAGTDVQLEFTLIGTTDEGNPIYRVDGSIPQGNEGKKGESQMIISKVSDNVEAVSNHCYQYDVENQNGYTITPSENLADATLFMVETFGNTPIIFAAGGPITEIYLAQSMDFVYPTEAAWMSYTATRFGNVLKVNRELYIKKQ